MTWVVYFILCLGSLRFFVSVWVPPAAFCKGHIASGVSNRYIRGNNPHDLGSTPIILILLI